MKIQEWSEKHEREFRDAVRYIAEDILDGDELSSALDHHSDLFQIERDALAHEWDLRGAAAIEEMRY